MTITTEIYWDKKPSDAEYAITTAKLVDLRDRGLATYGQTGDHPVVREWLTEEAAQEWIDCLMSLDTKPLDAKIVIK